MTVKQYTDFVVPQIASGNLYESRITGSIPRNSQSDNIAKLMLLNLNNSEDLISRITNQTFEVSYYDKFNQSEFSLRLLLQFLREFKNLTEIKVSKIAINLCPTDFNSYKSPKYIIHNYQKLEDYQRKLTSIKNDFDFYCQISQIEKQPHYRYFEFKNDKINFILRIDGGLAHGLSPIKYLVDSDLEDKNESFEIRKYVSHDLIYNISIED